jgi:Leucine-rich repeat (LRR) protein
MQILDLDDNLFSSISPSWKLPKSLSRLGLSRNRIHGTIPATLGRQSGDPNFDWMTIDLSNNALEGSIPSNWNQSLPAGLMWIKLSNNALTGALSS